jgi:hypothetical protein
MVQNSKISGDMACVPSATARKLLLLTQQLNAKFSAAIQI